eukprot:g9058.t1
MEAGVDHWGIRKAAWQLEDVLHDVNIDVYPDKPEAREAQFEFVWAEASWIKILHFLIQVQLLVKCHLRGDLAVAAKASLRTAPKGFDSLEVEHVSTPLPVKDWYGKISS